MVTYKFANARTESIRPSTSRYVYRFVCDLQGLLGYTPEEIHAMVAQQDAAAAAAAAASSAASSSSVTNGNSGSVAASPVKQEND